MFWKKQTPSLDVWSKLATNVAARDKSIKVIQYGSRMLLAFYGKVLPPCTLSALTNATYISSLARKSFRMLKSVNHLTNIVKLAEQKPSSSQQNLIKAIQLIEQVFWAIFFYYDNKSFLSLTRVIKNDPKRDSLWFQIAWFGADISYLIGTIIQLIQLTASLENLQKKLQQNKLFKYENGNMSLKNNNNNNETETETEKAVVSSTESETDTEESFNGCNESSPEPDFDENEILLEISKLESKTPELYWCLIKALLHCSVSVNNYPFCFWKKLFGERLSDGPIGFFGILSSLMIIVEAWPTVELEDTDIK